MGDVANPLAGLLALWGGVVLLAIGHSQVRNPRPPAAMVRVEAGSLSTRRRRHVQSAGSAMMGVGLFTSITGLLLLVL